MRSATVVVLHAFVAQVSAKELAANDVGNAHDSMDKLADKLVDMLFDRVALKAPQFQPGHPRWASPVLPRSSRLPPAVTQVDKKIARNAAAAADGAFKQRREALKQCLVREYTSFFRPFEEEFYSEGISFTDPLKSLKGKASYKSDIEIVTGQSFVAKILLSDNFLDLHAVEDMPGDPTRLRTRWTAGFVFKLLPWKPKVAFSGVSEYVIDPVSAVVLSQRDYWDSLSLQDGGSYAPEVALGGVADLLGQLLPADALEPAGTSWQLLRKARAYRIYRADDGLVFALDATGSKAGLEGVERELKMHGLVPGQRMKVKGIEAIKVQSPHPWEQPRSSWLQNFLGGLS